MWIKQILRGVYDIDRIYALQIVETTIVIKNDPHSYEVN